MTCHLFLQEQLLRAQRSEASNGTFQAQSPTLQPVEQTVGCRKGGSQHVKFHLVPSF